MNGQEHDIFSLPQDFFEGCREGYDEIPEIVCYTQDDLDDIPEDYDGLIILRASNDNDDEFRLFVRHDQFGKYRTYQVEGNLLVNVMVGNCEIIAHGRACINCHGHKTNIKAYDSAVIIGCALADVEAYDDALVFKDTPWGVKLHDKAQRIETPQPRYSKTLYAYLLACLSFTRVYDSRLDLDDGYYYTTSSDWLGWRKSSDNAHGGLDVSWAHEADNTYIIACYAQEYTEQLLNELQQAADEEFDGQQLQTLYGRYEQLYD